MDTMDFILEKMGNLLHTGILSLEQAAPVVQEKQENNPIFRCRQLQEFLINGAKRQDVPYIYRDEYKVYFGCIKQAETFYLAGPMSVEMLSRIELHNFYRSYGIEPALEKGLKIFSFTNVLDVVETLAALVQNKQYEYQDLTTGNRLTAYSKESETQEQVLFKLKEEEEELYHHTYQEEVKLLNFVREGLAEAAVRRCQSLDTDLGKMSSKEMNHWKNAAVVGITLCTRAAIEGGVSPAVAYRLSDFYIQKCDGCKDEAQMLEYRNRAVEDLTKKVYEKKHKKQSSSHVEQCKHYVEKHYREKIYLSEIADTLGLSENYLSRLFKKDEGIRLQDYIVGIRLEHAANLLKYSGESIADIAEYVSFPSQSYMGKLFKNKYQLSPRKYRELYKPADYYDSDGHAESEFREKKR